MPFIAIQLHEQIIKELDTGRTRIHRYRITLNQSQIEYGVAWIQLQIQGHIESVTDRTQSSLDTADTTCTGPFTGRLLSLKLT